MEGMELTPKPLTHTAHEFYSMQYDRKADPNAPFWKRKPIKQVTSEKREEAVEAAPEPVEGPAEVQEAPPVEIEAAPEAPKPQPAPPEPAAVEANTSPAEAEVIDPNTDPVPDPKPTSSGSVH
jgi:hypothetical protein